MMNWKNLKFEVLFKCLRDAKKLEFHTTCLEVFILISISVLTCLINSVLKNGHLFSLMLWKELAGTVKHLIVNNKSVKLLLLYYWNSLRKI